VVATFPSAGDPLKSPAEDFRGFQRMRGGFLVRRRPSAANLAAAGRINAEHYALWRR